MRAGARRRRRLVAAGLLLLLAGCAGRPPAEDARGTALSPGELTDLLRRWADEWARFDGLRAAIELGIQGRGRHDRAAAVLLVAPAALRLEVVSAFGLPALVAVARPDELTVFRVADRAAQTGRPTPDAVFRWLGMPVAPELLVRLLVGQVPPPLDPTAVRLHATPSPHFAYQRDGATHQVWVTPEGRPERLVLVGPSGETHLRARFARVLSGDVGSLRIEAPHRDTTITVRYLSAQYGPVQPELFTLTLPPDVRVERID